MAQKSLVPLSFPGGRERVSLIEFMTRVNKHFIICLILGLFPLSVHCQTVREKAAHLFIVPACPDLGDSHKALLLAFLAQEPVGGVIFSCGTLEEQRGWIEEIQRIAPLHIFQDAEWGVGMRLRDVPSLPKPLTLGAVQDRDLLVAYGREIARQCRLAGVSGNFAPCVDLLTDLENRVIGSRSFGDDPREVAWRGVAVMQGIRDGGIIPCAKHFPGHGDTALDSHSQLPCVNRTKEELEEREWVPFTALIREGVELVMMGHLFFPHLDKEVASLSAPIIQGLLRQELGYTGVVVTDSLTMGALAGKGAFPELSVQALLAGADLILAGDHREEVVKRLLEKEISEAIDLVAASIPEYLIDEKLTRLSTLSPRGELPEERKELALELFRAALTWVGEAPFSPIAGGRLILEREDSELLALFKEKGFEGEEVIYVLKRGDSLPETLSDGAIVLLFDGPEALAKIPEGVSVLVAYEDVPEAKRAAVELLSGEFPPLGKLPIQVSKAVWKETVSGMESSGGETL